MAEGSHDLIRAARNFFRVKGAALDVVPVVVVDNNSLGPYPPYRAWHWGSSLVAGVGNFGYLGFKNGDDPATQKSALVIDTIRIKQVSAGVFDWMYGFVISGAGGLTLSSGQAGDANLEKDLVIQTEPRIGNVLAMAGQNAGAFVTAVFPAAGIGIVQEIPGPFILPPGGMWAISANIFQMSTFLWARGRYYPSL